MIKVTPDEPLGLRQQLLAVAGVELTFPAFTILAVNGEELRRTISNTGMEAIEGVDYYFQVLAEDVTFYRITARDRFQRVTAAHTLLFEITHVRSDVFGWVRLDALLHSEVEAVSLRTTYNPINPFLPTT